ncbi:hypothetical protein DN545_42110, partial [Burkholderia multivorans]
MTHPVAVAEICAGWKLDAQAIMAALLHDVMEDQGVTKSELAQRFGTTKANVTEVLKRLDELGLIHRVPYRPPELTAAGETIAVSMVRRHRLIETFLVESLGYSWDEIHDEAESLEHAASDLLIDRIDEFLGHPAADPHGDP